jgi:hypothetical protein
MIPKRIIHIYCAPAGQSDELPLICRAAVANAKLLHPEFEHVLFDRARMTAFLDCEFPQYREVMGRFPHPIQQFDFFRYLAVYRLGGFYFDLDVFLACRLDPLLDLGCVFPFEELTISRFLRDEYGIDWEMANYGFGAAPGDPFIGAVIDNCVRGLQDPLWAAQMMRGIPRWFQGQFFAPVTTGPGMVSRTFAENRELRSNVTVLFPADVSDASTWRCFGDFGVHLMQASWRKRDGFIRSRLARMWEARRRNFLETKSRALGPHRIGDWRHYP